MVRLGVFNIGAIFDFIFEFQFQYGAIGRQQVFATLCGLVGFNSSMVRLGAKSISSLLTVILFQFQYGAIGRQRIGHPVDRLILFQFQYGAIGSVAGINPVGQIVRFNSSMVRLGVLKNILPILTDMFQFQYGAIGRHFSLNTAARHISFQFQYGAIGSILNTINALTLKRFNSSMVRLGVETRVGEMFCFVFQFQYGAIGRTLGGLSMFLITMFQFQYGAIGRFAERCCPDSCCVSIPVWCDWEPGRYKRPRSLILFQFQYGAIGS